MKEPFLSDRDKYDFIYTLKKALLHDKRVEESHFFEKLYRIRYFYKAKLTNDFWNFIEENFRKYNCEFYLREKKGFFSTTNIIKPTNIPHLVFNRQFPPRNVLKIKKELNKKLLKNKHGTYSTLKDRVILTASYIRCFLDEEFKHFMVEYSNDHNTSKNVDIIKLCDKYQEIFEPENQSSNIIDNIVQLFIENSIVYFEYFEENDLNLKSDNYISFLENDKKNMISRIFEVFAELIVDNSIDIDIKKLEYIPEKNSTKLNYDENDKIMIQNINKTLNGDFGFQRVKGVPNVSFNNSSKYGENCFEALVTWQNEMFKQVVYNYEIKNRINNV